MKPLSSSYNFSEQQNITPENLNGQTKENK